MRKRAAWIVRRGSAMGLALVGAVACVALWLAGPASALTLDEFRSLSVERPAPRLDVVPTNRGSDTFTPLDQPNQPPNYDQSAPVGSQARDEQNAAANELAGDAEALTTDDTEKKKLDDCLKGLAFNVAFDAGWNATNGGSFDLSAEIAKGRDQMLSCLGEQLGLGPIGAASLSNYLVERFVSRGVEATRLDPTVSAFVDWASVTAYYTL